jgi:hypothetical protein
VVGFFADGSAAADGSAICVGIERCCYNLGLLFFLTVMGYGLWVIDPVRALTP